MVGVVVCISLRLLCADLMFVFWVWWLRLRCWGVWMLCVVGLVIEHAGFFVVDVFTGVVCCLMLVWFGLGGYLALRFGKFAGYCYMIVVNVDCGFGGFACFSYGCLDGS